MTRQEIMDNYAKEQGYEDWEFLLDEFVMLYYTKNCNEIGAIKWLNNHQNNVIDLIQEELKKEIHEKVMNNDISFVIDDEGILNTPNL